MLFTAKLAMSKPENGPGVDDLVDVDVLGANFDLIDANIGTKTCTSATRPDNGANGVRFTGQIIFETDTKAYGIWDGTAWKMFDTQWQTYTTTWDITSGTSPTIGNGVLSAKSFRAGKKRSFLIQLTFGSTGVRGQAGQAYTFTLPSVPVDHQRMPGGGMFADLSAGDRYPIVGYWINSNVITMQYQKVVGSAVQFDSLGPTLPVTMTNPDEISFEGWYEEV